MDDAVTEILIQIKNVNNLMKEILRLYSEREDKIKHNIPFQK
jgi:hypothetical protein